jgi:hypothetical protein
MADQPSKLPTLVDDDSSAPKQADFFPRELVELEKARIASFDRRTDVARAAIDAERETEKELFAYHMKRLENEDAQNRREHGFASKFVWCGFSAGVIVTALLVYMAFFGTAAQSVMALQMLTTLGKLAAGAGIFVLLRQLWRVLFRRAPSE